MARHEEPIMIRRKRTIWIVVVVFVLLVVIIPIGFFGGREFQQEKRNRALIVAIKQMDAKAVKSLLQEGASVNACDTGPSHSLFWMLTHVLFQGQHESGDTDSRKSALGLIFSEEDIDQSSFSENDPTEADSIAVLLITHGADPHSPLNFGEGSRTPLELAASLRLTCTLKALLARGVEINAKDDIRRTALMYADEASTTILLEHGADPNIQDDGGNTALIDGCENEDLKKVRHLLAGGADPNIADNAGYTPLMRNQDPDISALLLEHGADVNARDAEGNSVLSHMKSDHTYVWGLKKEPRYVRMMRLLRAHGARE